MHRYWFLFLIFCSPHLQAALTVQPYLGPLNYTRLSGCCQSTGIRTGLGIRADLRLDDQKEWGFSGYTDRRWSEFAILKPLSITGTGVVRDPNPHDDSVSSKRLSYWNWTAYYGAGYFIHSTRTTTYDLPAITSGFSLIGQSQWNYNLNDIYSFFGLLQMNVALASDDKGYLYGLFVGSQIRL